MIWGYHYFRKHPHSNKRKWSRKWYSVSFQVQTAELDWVMSKQSALYKTTTKLHGESEDFHHIIHPFCLWWSVKTQAVKHGSKIDEWISKSRISFQLLHCMGCVSDSGLHLCKGLVVAGPGIQLPKTIRVDVWWLPSWVHIIFHLFNLWCSREKTTSLASSLPT